MHTKFESFHRNIRNRFSSYHTEVEIKFAKEVKQQSEEKETLENQISTLSDEKKN